MTPDLLNILMNQLLGCACDCLNQKSSCPCPCRIFISAGPPVWDLEACCTDGQLSIHVERLYVHGNFPSEQGQVNVCLAPLAADLNITLLRCFPAIVKDNAAAPTADEIQAASEPLYQDLYILTRCILCNLASRGRYQKSVFRGSRILPPNGGCSGVELRLTIELPDPLP